MPSIATTSDTMTVSRDVSPALKATVLTALLAVPVEQLTVKQLDQLKDATSRIPRGGDPASVLYDLFK